MSRQYKEYDISDFVNAGSINLKNITKAIQESSATGEDIGVVKNDTKLVIYGDVNDKEVLDALIRDHDPLEVLENPLELAIIKHTLGTHKFEDTYTPALDHDFVSEIKGGLEFDKILVRGDHGNYSEKIFYGESHEDENDDTVFTDPVIHKAYSYNINHSKKRARKTITLSWYLNDGTLHAKKKTIKRTYKGQAYFRFMKQQRIEIVEFLKLWVVSSMGFNAFYNPSSTLNGITTSEAVQDRGEEFIEHFDTDMGRYIDGATKPFIQAIENCTLGNNEGDEYDFRWLDEPITPTVPGGAAPGETIRDLLLTELKYPGH